MGELLMRGPLPFDAEPVLVLGLPLPDGTYARKAWLLRVQAGDVRSLCGISRSTVARALGVSVPTVWHWEHGTFAPAGRAGNAYCRVIAALAGHLAAYGA